MMGLPNAVVSFGHERTGIDLINIKTKGYVFVKLFDCKDTIYALSMFIGHKFIVKR